MADYTDYLEYDDNEHCPLKRIGCMECNETIAIREYRQDTKVYRIKPFSHIQRKTIPLHGNKYVDIMLCPTCAKKVLDLKKLEQTIRNGYMKEEDAKYNHRPDLKKKRFNKNKAEKLPLSYFKNILKNCKLIR